MLRKLTLCSAILLTACGGGGGGGGAPSADAFVSGTFQDANQTGKTFPTDRETHGYYGGACSGESNYFETDSGRIRIYGSTAFSADDFRAMATLIEQRLDETLSKFGLTWELFKEERGFLTIYAMRNVLGEMTSDPSLELGEDASGADAYDLWRQWSESERQSYVAGLPDKLNQQAEDLGFDQEEWWTPITDDQFQRLEKDFLIGCLSPGMGGGTFGEGTLAGILMPPERQQWPGSVGQIVTHELVHFIQQNLYNEAANPYLLPRWFSEGQAVFLSGQRIANQAHHYNYEPQEVIGFSDEYGDLGMAYQHYGLAYSYIANNNSQTSINDLLRLMKDTVDNPGLYELSVLETGEYGQPLVYGEAKAFQRAFDVTMYDHEGEPMTIDRFRTQYHDLMNIWQ